MKIIFFFSALVFSAVAFGQTATDADSSIQTVKIIKDPRLEVLALKQAEFNKITSSGRTAAKGYRLMVINSADKDLVMKVRAQLLQRFPEQKVYMSFQAPYIKLKFGNFVDKADAEKYKKLLTNTKLVSTSIYMVPEMVEVKPDKNKEKDDN